MSMWRTRSVATIAEATGERIEVVGLKKSFRRAGSGSRVNAIDGISLTIDPGEMVVLLGPSGCGKTTLLRCIAGLETPDEGEIRVGDRVVFSSRAKIDIGARDRNMSMIFQSYSLWPHMKVVDNVAYPLRSRGRAADARERALDVLQLVGLRDVADEYPGTLSGGQQQRVSLARAIVANPSAVLFDEPLSNVDAQVRAQLRTELRSMHTRVGFAGVYVTHDQEEALSIATRVAVLQRGKLVQLDTPQVVYRAPASAYVARFVGSANAVPVTLVGRSAADVMLAAPCGDLIATSSGVAVDDGATSGVAVIRPEDVTVLTAGASPRATTNLFDGIVTSYDYRGAQQETTVLVGDIELRALAHGSGDPLDPGERVRVQLPADRIRVVPE